jgi:hypothetical protein
MLYEVWAGTFCHFEGVSLMNLRNAVLVAAALVMPTIARPAHAGTFSSDFNSGQPGGTFVFGAASVLPNGGAGDSGVLELTPAAGDQYGAFLIDELDVDPVTNFTARMLVRISDQTCCGEPPNPNGPADGLSFNFTNAPPNPPTYGNPGEEGHPVGLSVNLDTWDNGGSEAPAIDVKYDGAPIGSFSIHPYTGARYVDLYVRLDDDGTIDVTYDGTPIFTDLATGHVATVGGQFLFGARTGGANSRHLIDDLTIDTNVIPEPSSLALLIVAGAAGLISFARRRFGKAIGR